MGLVTSQLGRRLHAVRAGRQLMLVRSWYMEWLQAIWHACYWCNRSKLPLALLSRLLPATGPLTHHFTSTRAWPI